MPSELPKDTTTTTSTTTFGHGKVKISSFPKDSYWFRSQKDKEDTFMETRAETICTQNGRREDEEEDSDSLPPSRRVSRGSTTTTTTRVVFVGEDETSFT